MQYQCSLLALVGKKKHIQQELEIENIVIFESEKKEEVFGCIEIHCASLHCVMIVRPHAVSNLNVPVCLWLRVGKAGPLHSLGKTYQHLPRKCTLGCKDSTAVRASLDRQLGISAPTYAECIPWSIVWKGLYRQRFIPWAYFPSFSVACPLSENG